MNQEEFFPIYPNIKRIINICKFKYNILEIILFKSVRIAVYLLNENDMVIESRQYLIEGSEYDAWSNDDKYIISLIKQKIQQGNL
jgi:hypothetical protein